MPKTEHDILMITHRRPSFTRMALERLLETCDDNMRVWVWHNGDHEETLDVVRSLSGHRRFHQLHISEENRKLREPTNWFWETSDGAFLSKVDDDCLLPDGWAQTLTAAHRANADLGAIGCWRFYDEDYMPEAAQRKMRSFEGGHRVMVNPWVQGSGYVMKREVFEQLGPLGDEESFSDYGIRSALAGWINGWYFPFIHEEHMDDPRSPHSAFTSQEAFERDRPLSAVNDRVTSLEEWKNRVRFMARSVQMANADPRYHVGWRKALRRVWRRLTRYAGVREPWRVTK